MTCIDNTQNKWFDPNQRMFTKLFFFLKIRIHVITHSYGMANLDELF